MKIIKIAKSNMLIFVNYNFAQSERDLRGFLIGLNMIKFVNGANAYWIRTDLGHIHDIP